MPDVIVNTSPLQFLHQIGKLDLLPAMYGHITVPEAVLFELDRGIAGGIDLPLLSRLGWVSIERVDPPAMQQVAPELGAGEREVLALGLASAGSLVVLDDAEARKHASSLRLHLTGTLGVLLKAKQQGRISAVAPLLDELESSNFYLDPKTREAVTKLARE